MLPCDRVRKNSERYGASPMSVIFEMDLKRKGASPPVLH